MGSKAPTARRLRRPARARPLPPIPRKARVPRRGRVRRPPGPITRFLANPKIRLWPKALSGAPPIVPRFSCPAITALMVTSGRRRLIAPRRHISPRPGAPRKLRATHHPLTSGLTPRLLIIISALTPRPPRRRPRAHRLRNRVPPLQPRPNPDGVNDNASLYRRVLLCLAGNKPIATAVECRAMPTASRRNSPAQLCAL